MEKFSLFTVAVFLFCGVISAQEDFDFDAMVAARTKKFNEACKRRKEKADEVREKLLEDDVPKEVADYAAWRQLFASRLRESDLTLVPDRYAMESWPIGTGQQY